MNKKIYCTLDTDLTPADRHGIHPVAGTGGQQHAPAQRLANCTRIVKYFHFLFHKQPPFKATPHNGARRFGQCFDPSESIFHTARLGQKIR